MPLKVVIANYSIIIIEEIARKLSELKKIKIIGKSFDTFKTMELVNLHLPDILILDLELNGGSGMDILKTVKKEKPHITVIILTNHNNDIYKDVCYEEGADFFIYQTTDFDKIIDVCRYIIVQKKNKKKK